MKTLTNSRFVSFAIICGMLVGLICNIDLNAQSNTSVTFNRIWSEKDAVQDVYEGILVHADFTIFGMSNKKCYAEVCINHTDGKLLDNGSPYYCLRKYFTPSSNNYTYYNEIYVFIPYKYLKIEGGSNLEYRVSIFEKNATFITGSNLVSFFINWRNPLGTLFICKDCCKQNAATVTLSHNSGYSSSFNIPATNNRFKIEDIPPGNYTVYFRSYTGGSSGKAEGFSAVTELKANKQIQIFAGSTANVSF